MARDPAGIRSRTMRVVSSVRLLLLALLVVAAPTPAAAELVTLAHSGLTIDGLGWRYEGVARSRFHAVDVDVLHRPGAAVEVELRHGCPTAPTGWSQARPVLLPAGFPLVWADPSGEAEVGCRTLARGTLVVWARIDDAAIGEGGELHGIVGRLVRAAAAPLDSQTALAAARSVEARRRPPPPTAFALGVRIARVSEPDLYRGASRLDELAGRIAMHFDPVVAGLEVAAGRADTGALRFGLDVLLGVGAVGRTGVASLSTGLAIDGQTRPGDDAAMDPPSIPAVLSIPLAVTGAVRVHPWVALGGRVALAWDLQDDARRSGGAPALGISDRLAVEAQAHLGRRTGLVLGLGYAEALGTGMLSFTVGVGRSLP